MKIAIVTGASSGMGKEFLERIDRQHFFDEIWAVARRKERLEEVAKTAKNKVRVLPFDLSLNESYREIENLLKTENPEVSFLVNASGFGQFGKVENVTLSQTMGMVDLNAKALAVITELTLPYMKEGAEIINFGSMSSFQPVPYMLTYGATKAFVLSYSRGLNVELRKRKIHVMAVCPGWVKTEFFDTAFLTNADNAVCYYNKYYTSTEVVDRAFKDLKKGKDLSICGFRNRAQAFFVKILPTKTVMKTWLKQQKHKW